LNADHILSMARGKPFHPFRVRTASGEAYTVNHPEPFWMDPAGEVFLVKDQQQGVALIDTASVTEFVRLPAAPRGKKSS
jgi:hypothetical protein